MKGSILLVDDNPDFLDSTRDVLEAEGYRVDTATNGEEALARATRSPFDVILMDIKMPGMNGVESFIRMKAKDPDIKVILFTAYSLEDLVMEARREGVCDVLDKPFDMARLLHAVEQVRGSLNPACILVVDDDRALCDSLSDLLTQRGYRVAVAGDAQEAVRTAKEEPFDVLLLDMKLPLLNGLEVYRRIKALQPNLATILMTGYAEEMRELVEKTLKENAYTCLAKPLKIEELMNLVDEVLEAKRKGRYHKKG